MKETVLYYNPNKAAHAAKLKSVFVRMGIRIKNISEVQLDETVGYLSGVNGFEAASEGGSGEQPEGSDITGEADNGVGAIDEEMLVMKDFSDRIFIFYYLFHIQRITYTQVLFCNFCYVIVKILTSI